MDSWTDCISIPIALLLQLVEAESRWCNGSFDDEDYQSGIMRTRCCYFMQKYVISAFLPDEKNTDPVVDFLSKGLPF